MTNSSGLSERIYMVQRYSKYGFFGVNYILRYYKYCFSSSIPGMPWETKISIPYSVWVEDLIYIYVYIHVVMSWDVLSVGVSKALYNCLFVQIELCQ